jgi:NAD-dependent SIR2 family protein deacetylase
MKRCTKCGEDKPPVEFRRDRSRRDGRYPQCKACEEEWRKSNAERLKAYHRAWNRANPEKKRAHDRRYRERQQVEDPQGYRESESRTAATGSDDA